MGIFWNRQLKRWIRFLDVGYRRIAQETKRRGGRMGSNYDRSFALRSA